MIVEFRTENATTMLIEVDENVDLKTIQKSIIDTKKFNDSINLYELDEQVITNVLTELNIQYKEIVPNKIVEY